MTHPTEEKIELKLLPIPTCTNCGTTENVTTEFNGWAYVDDSRNYSTLCPKCWKELSEYVSDMWSDYYSSVF